MKLFSFKLILLSYWVVLTKSLLIANPWTLVSDSLAATPPLDLSFEPVSWLVHFTAYSTLGILIRLALKPQSKFLGLVFCLALFHSGLCEYLQGFIPGRWPNLWDLASNAFGLMGSWVLVIHRQGLSLRSPLKTFQEKQAA